MTKIKICGLTRIEEIEIANKEKPDFIGFVFAKSRRRITPQQARELRSFLDKAIIPVGVFVDEKIENILATVHSGAVSAVQLHGAEDENFIEKLKLQTTVPIIKAVSVQKAGDAQNRENSAADFLLLDHKGGGTGEVFDWNHIGIGLKKPFFLAGGLNPENVAEAIKKIAPYAVDVSSGVEISSGAQTMKCAEKIRNFISVARSF
jgi:phosphoribosylanthranilate isomerase